MLLRGVDWEGYNLICLYTGGWSKSLPLTSTLYGDLKHHKTQPWASAAGCIQCTVLLCPLSLCTATCTGERLIGKPPRMIVVYWCCNGLYCHSKPRTTQVITYYKRSSFHLIVYWTLVGLLIHLVIIGNCV